MIADINEEGSRETVRLINEAGGSAEFIRCDVSVADDVRNAVESTVRHFGRLDHAFNNSGIEGVMGTTADYPLEAWDRVIAVNLTGAWLCMKYEIEQMLKQGKGSIVNNASILGTVAFANAGAYVAAKHGLLGITKTAALEYATQGIRINAVCPGFIETPMLDRGGITSNPETRRWVESLHPMKRLGTSDEIATAVIWLASDDASFVTGHAMLVDGGYVIQ